MIKNCETTAAGLPEVQAILEKPEDVCAVRWARDVAHIARLASCGRGTMCRDGIHQLWCIMDEIVNNKGTREDLELLAELCGVIIVAGDCEMAVTAASLIQTSMNTHADEWAVHVTRRRCPAKACTAFPVVAPVTPPEGGMRRRRR